MPSAVTGQPDQPGEAPVPGVPGVPGVLGVPAAAGEPVEQDGVGAPDGLQRLWMPHRMAYIKGEGKPPGGGDGEDCPFCRIPGLPDSDGLIVARGALVHGVVNPYP